MAVQEVVFSVTGRDPQAGEIDRLTNARPYSSGPRRWLTPTGEGIYHSSVVILEEEMEEEEAIAQATHWMELHSDAILGIDCEKTVEFQTLLLPEEGSRGFRIPADALRVFADAECEVLVQYSRVVTNDEIFQRG